MKATGRIVAVAAAFLVASTASFAQESWELPDPEFPAAGAASSRGVAVAEPVALPDPYLVAGFELSVAHSAVPLEGVPIALSFVPLEIVAQAAETDASTAPAATPQELRGLLNNEFYRDSLRLKKLAEDAFEYGDYDAAASYAAQAAAAADKSDEYVALRLRMKAADDAIAAARAKLGWASGIGAEKNYPTRYAEASSSLEAALGYRDSGDYEAAVQSARRVVDLLANLDSAAPLPAVYVVRTWAEARDCFWNIAGRTYVYGDPTKWQRLYEANKTKLPRPSNPNLVYPGTVLDIPSLMGEDRTGTWDAKTTYTSLPDRKR